MKQKLIFLAGFIGIGIIIYSVIRVASSRSPKLGELRVDSQPTATVFIDNKNIGKTPYKDKINAGEYTIKLVPDSTTTQLTPWQGKITVGQNLLTFVNANLNDTELSSAVDVVWLEKITSKQSELSVTTSPDGATLLVDDVSRGVTPLSIQDITAGEHSVSVTNIGFLTRSIKIKTTAGYRVIANLKLALSGAVQQPEPTDVISSSTSATPKDTAAKTTPSGKTTPTPSVKVTVSQSPVNDPAKPYAVIKDTPTGFLRVRMEASTSATESGRVNPGEKYSIVDTKNGWYEIKYDTSKSGWISGQYADKVE